ncbi:hypothetical protein [Actinomadura alba]|uniref:Alpha/beta hydrolase n=1 Tax=Actinomadura alba TaxID=406431 RepID=A0ABR7LQB7_9ACTN|nr:hypothetical protein [Actinomadura alba]MBC6466863.1 hypothetical protein [Actinomadura alba]
MTPGTLVLLHAPLATAAVWGPIPETLRSHGADVVVPEIHDQIGDHGDDHNGAQRPPGTGRYVARAALEIAAHRPAQPLVLVAHGAAGAVLPKLGAAQRAAHRTVGGYVLVDAEFPEPAELRGDWPDAPCGYLRTAEPYELEARQARLRGWPVREPAGGHAGTLADAAEALRELIAAL